MEKEVPVLRIVSKEIEVEPKAMSKCLHQNLGSVPKFYTPDCENSLIVAVVFSPFTSSMLLC